MSLVIILSILGLYSGKAWIETSQADFADGAFECNLFSTLHENGTLLFTTPYDYNNDGYIDIVVSNEMADYSTVYWGDSTGYSAENATNYPGNSKGDWVAGDVDNDGYTELLSAQGDNYRIRIFKGSPTGPLPNNYRDVPLSNWNESCYLADLNKDGYLDLIVNQYSAGYGGIFWGCANGYSSSKLTLLPSSAGEHNIEVADFNKDGCLDLLFIREENNTKSYIFWGGSEGYSVNNKFVLSNPPELPSGSSIGDLDDDGWLDIVLTSFYGSVSYVYRGTGQGFVLWATLQAGSCFGGSSIADINKDGFLDILYLRGYGIDLPPVIYWGSAAGYSETNKSLIGPAVDASGALVADFNHDGNLDVFVDNYAYPPENSYFLMGPTFSNPTMFLPNRRDAHAIFREIGNVYTRAYDEKYLSSVFNAGKRVDWDMIQWSENQPHGAEIIVSVHTGNTPVPDQTWSPWTVVTNGGSIPNHLDSRYIQYQAILSYRDPARQPELKDIEIYYRIESELLASAVIKPEVVNLKSRGVFTAFLTLPAGYDPGDIDPSTVQCNGARLINYEITPGYMIAKFNVQDLVGVAPGPKVEFRVIGQLNSGLDFYGIDTVRVINQDELVLCCSPNPFTDRTTLTIETGDQPSSAAHCRARVFNLNGSEVRSFTNLSSTDGGKILISWNRRDNHGRRVAAGVYLFRVETESNSFAKKVIILD
jgi:hypothetical protein